VALTPIPTDSYTIATSSVVNGERRSRIEHLTMSRFPPVFPVLASVILAAQVWCVVQLVRSCQAEWRRVE
jgi:hypothetical protein